MSLIALAICLVLVWVCLLVGGFAMFVVGVKDREFDVAAIGWLLVVVCLLTALFLLDTPYAP